MAAIDVDQVYTDMLLWLPESNVLSEAQIKSIIVLVIANELPADDDTYYAQCLCLSLRAVGSANLSKSSVNSSGIQKEKVGDLETTYFSSTQWKSGWEDFLDSLRDICPIFGYYGLSTKGGIKITTSTTPNFNPCCDDNDLTF